MVSFGCVHRGLSMEISQSPCDNHRFGMVLDRIINEIPPPPSYNHGFGMVPDRIIDGNLRTFFLQSEVLDSSE